MGMNTSQIVLGTFFFAFIAVFILILSSKRVRASLSGDSGTEITSDEVVEGVGFGKLGGAAGAFGGVTVGAVEDNQVGDTAKK